MTAVKVNPDLWATSILPEGMIEKWLAADGAFVEAGEPIAMLRIEGALHDLQSPAEGWLTIDRKVNAVIEPGAVIGHIGARPERSHTAA
jgi:pyruvate/2-oxoglutarate dehydrogenase complex dihydrolipoamide acyltransferase (E2) component